MNGGNIRLRMTLKINVGCLSLASEMGVASCPNIFFRCQHPKARSVEGEGVGEMGMES